MLSTCQDDSEEPMPEVKLDRLNKDKQRLLASQSSAVTATSEALHFESLVDFFQKYQTVVPNLQLRKKTMKLISHRLKVLRSSIAAKAMRSKEIFTKHCDSVLQKTAKLRSLQSDLAKHYDNTDEVVRK